MAQRAPSARYLAGFAAVAAVLAPISATAVCSVVDWPPLGSAEERALHTRWQRECARIDANRAGFLRDAQLGRRGYDEVAAAAERVSAGTFGCRKDSAYAFRLIEATLPDPIPLDVDWHKLERAMQLLPVQERLIEGERRRKIEGMHWLLAQSRVSLAARGWSQEETDRFLSEPGHWEFALANFGTTPLQWRSPGQVRVFQQNRNPEVDSAVFRLLNDPASRRFDPQRAVALGADSPESAYRLAAIELLLTSPHVQRDVPLARAIAAASADRSLHITAARRLLDGTPGPQELDAAGSLLGWYSPYIHFPEDEMRAAAELWQVLARHLAASSDPQRRALGDTVLSTGDPHPPHMPALPKLDGPLVVFDRWPQALPTLDPGPPERWEDYPARALRDELAGLVGVGLLFGPDGRFRQLWVSRSSGSAVLDEAATRALSRYTRPKLADLRLPGVSGHSALVPFVEVEWHIGRAEGLPLGAAVEGNRIVVVGELRHQTNYDRVIC